MGLGGRTHPNGGSGIVPRKDHEFAKEFNPPLSPLPWALLGITKGPPRVH